jgi:hypothetical protein
MTDSHDKNAILALGAKIVNYLAQNQRLNDEISERQRELASNQSVISDCVSGLRVFGIDLNAPDAWEQFSTDFGDEIADLIHGPSQHQQPHGIEPRPQQSFIATQQPISTLLLERLKDVGFHGSKALPLRNFLKDKYNVETHYKTVGMTLYRLSQERPPKVHRKGNPWFFGPPLGETKNPGGDTPGQTSLLDEGGTDA